MNQKERIMAENAQVLGFGVSSDGGVVLIKKNRPEWQKGRFNGLGGKVKAAESMPDAMSREFQEECGVIVDPDRWKVVGEMHCGPSEACSIGTYVVVFTAELTVDEINEAETQTDEEIEVFQLPIDSDDASQFIGNVPGMIALITANEADRPKSFVFTYD